MSTNNYKRGGTGVTLCGDQTKGVPAMSTSLLYHAYGLKGVKYISTEYKNGCTMFRAEVTSTIENYPACGIWETVHQKGFKERMIRLLPMGMRPTYLCLGVWRLQCKRWGALRWPRLPFVKRMSFLFSKCCGEKPPTSKRLPWI